MEKSLFFLSLVLLIGCVQQIEPIDELVSESSSTEPVINLVQAENIQETSAEIYWELTQNTDGVVEYGKTSSYGLSTQKDSNLKKNHRQELQNLEPNTTYYFRVRSRDKNGVEVVSSGASFKTKEESAPVLQSYPPVLISANRLNGSYTLKFSQQLSNGVGPTEGPDTFINGQDMEDRRNYSGLERTIAGLNPYQRQCFRLEAHWEQFDPKRYPLSNEICVEPLEYPAPKILSLNVNNIQENSARINVSLDLASNARIDLGVSASMLSQTILSSSYQTSHTLNLTNLQPETTYYYRLTSVSENNKQVVSNIASFNTLKPEPAEIIALAPVLESVIREGSNYVLKFSQPLSNGEGPSLPPDTFVNGSDTEDRFSHSGFERTISGLDIYTEQCFRLEAHWEQLTPKEWPLSNEICVAAAENSNPNPNPNPSPSPNPNPPPVSNELKAFPSAEGAGAYTQGGRGGRVIHVTKLNDDGSEGTFRWALTRSYPRIVVFDVSGEITLNNTLYVSGSQYSRLTIAGQTAPRGGITVRGAPIFFAGIEHLIIRYIRVRPFNSQGAGEGNDAISCVGCRYVVYDHLSASGGGDETIDFWHYGGRPSGEISLQRMLIGESQNGGLAGGQQNPDTWSTLTYFSNHHNLYAHSYNRMPSNAPGGKHEFINNLVINWRYKLISAECNARVNHIGNYYKPGRTSNTSQGGGGLNMLAVATTYNGNYIYDVKVHSSGNYYQGMSFANNDNTQAWKLSHDGQLAGPTSGKSRSDYFSNAAFPMEGVPVTTTTAEQAVQDVTNDVGANKYLNADGSFGTWQDSLDLEYISDFLNGTYTNCQGRCSGEGFAWYTGVGFDYPSIPRNTRMLSYDSDFDGMPNEWETANGLNPNIDDSADDQDNDGYTNIEEFLNRVDY